ncbi:hypothetical protein [Burkholderia lata]|uniref:hypothetical protein n=1 Tax=Burkholderia lata (strain ATCC 17760 / DSM 23089 / LMG 22485 / NCIMB 9086 / R18194 / 383) TaxID=482957 RepID=UPI001581FCE7|nr:hypothetical protein [Burkholderia lata]
MITVQRIRYLPDITGLIVQAVLVAVLSMFVPPAEIPRPLWVPIYAAWAVCAIFIWRKVEPTNKPWLLIGLYSVGGAAIWYAVTRAISRWIFGSVEAELSQVFDLLVALAISPGLTFVAIAGWARALIRRKQG